MPSDRMLKPRKAPRRNLDVGAFSHAREETLARRVTASMAIQCLQLLALRHPDIQTANQSTIRTWADRGKVRKYGRDQYGLQQYDLDDIVRVATGHAADPIPA